MSTQGLKKVSEYVKNNLHKFLLVAVILTFCLAMRYTAIGKYVSYIENATQVTASDFCFESNYLEEITEYNPVPTNYVGKWDANSANDTFTGSQKTITIEMRNYNNYLRYDDNDVFYYLEASYKVGTSSTSYVTDDQLITIQYKKAEGDTSDYRYITGYDASGAAITKPLGHIAGGGRSKQDVEVYFRSDTAINEVTFIKVKAYCLSYNQLASGLTGTAISSDAYAGSYSKVLESEFKIGSETANATVTYSIDTLTENQAWCIYLKCSGLENQSSATVRVFYDPAQVELTKLTGTSAAIELDNCTFLTGMTHITTCTKYVDIVANSGSVVPVYFRNTEDYTAGNMDWYCIATYVKPEGTSTGAITLNHNLKLAKAK